VSDPDLHHRDDSKCSRIVPESRVPCARTPKILVISRKLSA
jgi:hypothetical protein